MRQKEVAQRNKEEEKVHSLNLRVLLVSLLRVVVSSCDNLLSRDFHGEVSIDVSSSHMNVSMPKDIEQLF
jgi:hypothetical protein